MSPAKAKVFRSGRSQAVRLPEEFGIDTSEVTIRRDGDTVAPRIAQARNAETDEWAWLAKPKPLDPDGIAAIDGVRLENREA